MNITNLLDFEQISRTFMERMHESRSYNLMTLDELTNNYTSIPWREYFDKLLPNNITVEENEVVIVTLPSFISDLEKLLSTTPKRVQANYVIWRAVEASVGNLNNDIRNRGLAFWTGLSSRPRWQECVDFISEHLSVAVGAMYVRKYFNKEAKQKVADIAMDIRNQFYKMLEQVEWMDDSMRQNALEKAAAMSSYVAYPDELLNDTKLEKLYENLELSGGVYLDSILNLTFFIVESSFGELRKPVNKNDWVSHAHAASVEPFYKESENSINFPAGILQGAFFSSDQPNYMNYGGIGFDIGHEIVHGFVNMEDQFNKDENLSEWSSNAENYFKQVECIIDQYGNYTAKEVGLESTDRSRIIETFVISRRNAIKTRIENIADNAAVKEAYFAYNDWAEKNELEQKLPGLPYSPKQMFWIAVANSRCEKWGSAALEHFIKTGKRSPSKFRILGSLSNMPEFSKDFNCPIRTKMNPENKCSVW